MLQKHMTHQFSMLLHINPWHVKLWPHTRVISINALNDFARNGLHTIEQPQLMVFPHSYYIKKPSDLRLN